MVPGIVLAAGASSRMGRPKAELRLGPDGPTFVQAVVDTLRQGGVGPVVVVAGAHPDAVRRALTSADDVSVVEHAGWAAGQLSSLVAGLDAVEAPAVEAVMMTLVDVPLVQPATVAALLARWRATRAPIVRPAIGERHGHPVVFDRVTFARLRAAPVELGAKVVLAEFAAAVLDVATDDAGVLRDIDTPAEYQALTRVSGGGSAGQRP